MAELVLALAAVALGAAESPEARLPVSLDPAAVRALPVQHNGRWPPLDTLAREQEKYRQQFADTFGSAALEAMQEQTLKNLAVFGQALNMFAPFTSFASVSAAAKEAPKKAEAPQPSNVEIDELKSQLAAIQAQLNELAGQK